MSTISKEDLLKFMEIAQKMLATIETPELKELEEKENGGGGVQAKPKGSRKPKPKPKQKAKTKPVTKPATKPKRKPVPLIEDDESEEDEGDEEEVVTKSGRRKIRQIEDKGTQTRREQFRPNKKRPNNFLKLMSNSSIKNDVNKELAKAKFLNDKVQAAPRGMRESSLVEIRCSDCRDIFEVSASLIHNQNRFKCNNCSRRG